MYIVVDIFDTHFPSIVCNEDGYPLLFDSEEDAQQEANQCQRAVVVEY